MYQWRVLAVTFFSAAIVLENVVWVVVSGAHCGCSNHLRTPEAVSR